MKKNSSVAASVATTAFLVLCATVPAAALAATTPSLGAAGSYAILSSTYTNTGAGTSVSGDIGFTTGPAVAPAGVHTNYGSGAPYATAGVDQAGTLSALASQPCTFTFAPGAIDLATDTTHGPIGVYTPGVYCVTGAASIGTGGITLSGSGTYIFRIDGALTSAAGATVALAGASACDVFWTPTQAATLAANTTFVGTVIADAGITVGANTSWTGRNLVFGGTVTTDANTIATPSCGALPPPVVAPVVAPVPPAAALAPVVAPVASPVVQPVLAPVPAVVVASLPNTGIGPDDGGSIALGIAISVSLLLVVSSLYLARKKLAIFTK